MTMRPPGTSPSEQREERRARKAHVQTALIYGIGQIALGVLVVVLAYETAQAAPMGEEQSKALLAILIAFALYALYRGTRQLREGLAQRRALRVRDSPRRTTP